MDSRLVGRNLLSKSQAQFVTRSGTFHVGALSTTTLADGTPVQVVTSTDASNAGIWNDCVVSVPAGTPLTWMGTAIAPSGVLLQPALEHVGPSGGSISGGTVALDPVVPTAFAFSRITSTEDKPRPHWYFQNLAVGQSAQLWHIGVFIGRVPAEFWQLPPF